MTTLEKLEELIYHGFKESDRKIQEAVQETNRRFQESERLFQEFQKENAKQREEFRSQFFGLNKSLGLFAESMVQPGVRRLFSERGILLTGVYSRLEQRLNGGTMEIDVLGEGADVVVAIEVKMQLRLDDVKEFLEKLPKFFDFFPRFRGQKLYGAVAGMSINAGVARYAYQKGLFVLSPAGENMEILNDEKFKPRVFGGPANKKTRRKK